jgi:hypothetical protein
VFSEQEEERERDRKKNSELSSICAIGSRIDLLTTFDFLTFVFLFSKIMATITSGNSSKTNSNTTSPASFNLAGETASLTTTASSSSLVTSTRDRCRRCNQLVYCTERIGPVKDYLYHKLCFKCLKCDRQLDFKTYFTNSDDLNDKEIYCQSHAPRSGKGVFSTENMSIHNVMNAPKLSVMQKLDDRLKVFYRSFRIISQICFSLGYTS